MEQRDLSGMRAYAEELTGQLTSLRRGLADLRRELGSVTATARSADGFITVTVGPQGQLVQLTIDPRIYRRPDSTWLAEQILEATRKAAADAARQVQLTADRYASGSDAKSIVDGRADLSRFDVVIEELMKGAQG